MLSCLASPSSPLLLACAARDCLWMLGSMMCRYSYSFSLCAVWEIITATKCPDFLQDFFRIYYVIILSPMEMGNLIHKPMRGFVRTSLGSQRFLRRLGGFHTFDIKNDYFRQILLKRLKHLCNYWQKLRISRAIPSNMSFPEDSRGTKLLP